MKRAIITALTLTLALALPEPEGGVGLQNLHRLRRQATSKGGKCSTSADCIAPNVCSKWGWCQWTKIYGEDGPSQGSAAPDGGRSGQCVTSADCASRVPYCSKLGFCHGGRLPFDEAQLEIDDAVFQTPPQDQPQGYINNNVKKNSPIFINANDGLAKQVQSGRDGNFDYTSRDCPSASAVDCIESACKALQGLNKRAYDACSQECQQRC